MSLVVGSVREGRITLVADTKLTQQHQDELNRHVYERPCLKLIILRKDLCVGVAGNDPYGSIGALFDHRDSDLNAILQLCRKRHFGEFVVAHLGGGPTLWSVRHGGIRQASPGERIWAGDPAGQEIFEQRYTEWHGAETEPFRLLSSMQWLVEFDAARTIGGHVTRVESLRDGFSYMTDGRRVGPEMMHAAIEPGADQQTFKLKLTTPDGGDTTFLLVDVAAGTEPTFGALAYLVRPWNVAVLFPHGAAHKPVRISAESIAEVIHVAGSRYQQHLTTATA